MVKGGAAIVVDVAGNRTLRVVPCSGMLSIMMVPLWPWMMPKMVGLALGCVRCNEEHSTLYTKEDGCQQGRMRDCGIRDGRFVAPSRYLFARVGE